MRGELNEAGRRRAAALWTYRAAAEREAEARFRRLSVELEQVKADPIVVGLSAQAAQDEARHHVLCVELARALNDRAEPSKAPKPPGAERRQAPAPPPVHLGRPDRREQVLAEVVAMSCVTETLSAALLVEMRAQACDPQVRQTVHEVLCDEVDHSRLGWAHLAAEAGRGRVNWLAPHLPAMLAATVHEELFEDSAPEDATSEVLAGLGGLRRHTRRELFTGTMLGVVFPGLRRFGVDTSLAEAWLERRLASAQRARPQVLGELTQHLGLR